MNTKIENVMSAKIQKTLNWAAVMVTALVIGMTTNVTLTLWPALAVVVGVFIGIFAVTVTRENQYLSGGIGALVMAALGVLVSAKIGSVSPAVVLVAMGLAVAIMVALGVYVWKSGKDFRGIGKYLFWGFVGLAVMNFVLVLMGIGIPTVLSVMAIGLYSGSVMYTVSELKEGDDETPTELALSLAIDFAGLVMNLIAIMDD